MKTTENKVAKKLAVLSVIPAVILLSTSAMAALSACSSAGRTAASALTASMDTDVANSKPTMTTMCFNDVNISTITYWYRFAGITESGGKAQVQVVIKYRDGTPDSTYNTVDYPVPARPVPPCTNPPKTVDDDFYKWFTALKTSSYANKAVVIDCMKVRPATTSTKTSVDDPATGGDLSF